MTDKANSQAVEAAIELLAHFQSRLGSRRENCENKALWDRINVASAGLHALTSQQEVAAGVGGVLTDAEVIAHAKAAGFTYLPPDPDIDGDGAGFPGGFDLEHGLESMRRLLSASRSPAPAGVAGGVEVQGVEPVEKFYSTDEEHYTYGSEHEAMEALEDSGTLEVGSVIYAGEADHPLPSRYLDVDCLMESMGERACEEASEWADDFPEVTKEKRAEFAALAGSWLDANVPVRFYLVKNVEAITITAEMLAEFHADQANPATEQGRAVDVGAGK